MRLKQIVQLQTDYKELLKLDEVDTVVVTAAWESHIPVCIDAMRSGIMMGTACMLDGMIERMEAELGCKTTVIITGGIAKFIAPLCKTPMIYDKDLLVKGLAALYRDNSRQHRQ